MENHANDRIGAAIKAITYQSLIYEIFAKVDGKQWQYVDKQLRKVIEFFAECRSRNIRSRSLLRQQ